MIVGGAFSKALGLNSALSPSAGECLMRHFRVRCMPSQLALPPHFAPKSSGHGLKSVANALKQIGCWAQTLDFDALLGARTFGFGQEPDNSTGCDHESI